VLYPDTANADSPFSKVAVRQAVEYAIDKENLVKVSGFGIFGSAYQDASETTVGYLTDIQPRKFDLNKAKELLALAGYPNGFDCTLTITIPAPDVKDAQVALQTMLAKVGIKCTLEYADSAKYANYMVKGWKNTLIYSPANVEGNFTGTVQTYYTIPNYYVSLKGPDNMMELYKAALTSAEVDPVKVKALSKAMWDYCDLIPVTYMGTGQVYYDYLKDAGFLTFAAQMNWAPENAWMDK
jgi:ABC-type transport system substrate-binding protein